MLVLLSYSLWTAVEFLEVGEMCRALSMGLKLSRLNEVELWLVEDFMGKRRCEGQDMTAGERSLPKAVLA